MRTAAITVVVVIAALLFAPVALAHGDDTPVGELAGSWSVEALPLFAAALFLTLYVRAFVRLRRRGRTGYTQPWRAAAAAGAVAAGLVAVSSPLDAVAEEYLISAHMLQHVVLGDVVPALAAIALRGPLFYLLIPARLLRPLVQSAPLRASVGYIARPQVSFAVWAASLSFWHVPAVYDAALRREALHDLEHLSFVVGGLLVWLQLLAIARRRSPLIRLRFLVAVYALGAVLAYALILSFRPYYSAYGSQDERLFGIGAPLDQKLAGVVMMAEQTVAVGLCALWLVREHLRERRRRDARGARRFAHRASAEEGR